MSRAIDLEHLGRDRVICAYEIDGLIVDPGPTSCIDTLLGRLEHEPRALLLTHIHLDHAGAAGTLCRLYPALQVYVHHRGARHMADPAKLIESATRLYGDDMDRLWGEMVPIDQERIHVLEGGETIEDTFEVTYTPGHASHHVTYLDRATGEAYTGDVAGVRLPPHEYTLVPTPPPDIDLDAWQHSVDLIEGMRPEALNLTHAGRFTDVPEHLERVRESLSARGRRSHDMDAEQFAEWSEAEVRAAVDFDTAEALLQAAPPDQLGAGLRRYWDKVAMR